VRLIFPILPPPWSDAIDIALVAVLLYALILSMRSARAHLALLGIGILGCVYLLAGQLGLELTAWLFQAFFAAFLIVLVVVFQGELRQIFERLAVLGLRRARGGAEVSDATQILSRALAELASQKHGALVVLPGTDPIERHVEGGIRLEGQLSFPLVLSLFDPHSPGHDGALIVEGNVVRRFAAHLPLSSSFEKLGMRGTRHAAALGLAERTDALCVVVSEERGTISVAHEGELRELVQPAELGAVLREFTVGAAAVEPATRLRALRANWRELAAATAVSLLLWVLVVPGAKTTEKSLRLPVVVQNLPEGYALERVEPDAVDVTVSGLRRDLFLLDARRFEVRVDGFLVGLGRRTFELSPEEVRRPPGVEVALLEPNVVRLVVTRDGVPNGAPAPGGKAP
jgi:uncharacterized protein (TIGR00159 family)